MAPPSTQKASIRTQLILLLLSYLRAGVAQVPLMADLIYYDRLR
jgi:hypothetical protein